MDYRNLGPHPKEIEQKVTPQADCPVCGEYSSNITIDGGTTTLKQCASCTVYFKDPLPSLKEQLKYFGEEYIPNADTLRIVHGQARERVFSQAAKTIYQHSCCAGRILDVGCAGGYFLDNYFRDWERWGVELSQFAAQQAAKSGITVFCGPIESSELPLAYFDAVIALDMVYYLRDPVVKLKAMRRLLKPNGIFVMTLATAGPRIRRRGAELLKGAHILFYTPESAHRLLFLAGFTDVKIVPSAGHRHDELPARIMFQVYEILATAVWHLQGSIISPRFLVTGRP